LNQAVDRLEDIASFSAITQSRGANAKGLPLPVNELVLAARAGDREVLDALDRAAQAFGLTLNQLNCAFNPEIIVLAGVLTEFGDLFLSRLNQELAAFAPIAGPPKVVNSKLGRFNGALGAAALAVHEWKPVSK
jgi:predicted NBD/HSP70 family sugar kinase